MRIIAERKKRKQKKERKEKKGRERRGKERDYPGGACSAGAQRVGPKGDGLAPYARPPPEPYP